VQVDASINTIEKGGGEAAGKESVKHQKTQRVLDGRLNAANDVARERNVEEESFNNESIAAKRKRSSRESESKKEGNEKVRDNEEEKRIPREEFDKFRELCQKQEPRQQPQCERRCERQYEERQRTRRERARKRQRKLK